MKKSVEIYIHFLNLTKYSCKKLNDLPYSCIFRSCFWLGLINAYKFPVVNFHLQDPATIIQSSGTPTKFYIYVIYINFAHAWVERSLNLAYFAFRIIL
jgi:hypothetical protein